jgi:transketolase
MAASGPRVSSLPGLARAIGYPRFPTPSEMSGEARPSGEQAGRAAASENPMPKRKKVAHLAPVENIPAQGLEAKPRVLAGRQPSIAELERFATVLRIDCVRMLAVAKSGHLDSSLSAADVVAALYYRVLRHDPERRSWPGRDRFVLCKGHAAPIQYAALARHGYFPYEDLMGLRKLDAHLQGHPDMTRTPGVEVSTGSLGQGLSMCLGIALGLRLDRIEQAHVFGLLSDGDCQEGQTWEAVMAAAHYGVTNLTAVIDYNHLQTDGTTEEVMDIKDVRKKFEAFEWEAVEIDGHDMAQIVEALEWSRGRERPAAVVCQTRKGRGVSVLEAQTGFHGKPPSPEQAEHALTELEAKLAEQTQALGLSR